MGTAPEGTSSGVCADRPTGAWHEAMAYASATDLVIALAPRVGHAIQAGDVVTAVLDDEAGGQLRSALGAAADEVHFPDPRDVHSVPGFTTATRWARSGRQITAPGGRALIIGQQLADLPGCGPEYWARLCLGIEVAAAGLPLTVICPFPDATADWDRNRTTHPLLGRAGGAEPNPDYRPPQDVLREHPAPPLPDLGPPAAELEFRATDLGTLRHLAAETAGRSGIGPDRVADVVLAVNEIASNSVEHGPGSGRLRMWTDGGVLAEIADAGRLTEQFPGMTLPPATGVRGRGFWLASELCDVMEIWTEAGTVVRLSWRR
jgi:anti-sigma regulatory factor (Ser/Thr protein kinase)